VPIPCKGDGMRDAGAADRARTALRAIPPDLPRPDWVRAGMAAHAAGLGFDDFNEWSAQAASYNEGDARSTWHSFKLGKGIGAGTLFQMAAEHGWEHNGGKRHRTLGRVRRNVKEPPRSSALSFDPTAVWGRCNRATSEHPYVEKKQAAAVPLDGLRVVPDGDPLVIAGESMAGALVVPVLRADRTLSSLQFIAAPDVAERLKARGKPDKLNLPGAGIEGWFTVGGRTPGGVVYVCEGIGQAWAAWKATGHAAVVCFGWGRVRAVATELRHLDASAQLVLVPDVGKEAEAETIARDLGAAVACLPQDWSSNSDVNDYAVREGFDMLEALLERAVRPPLPEPRYKLLSGNELRDLPPLAWRVRGVLPATGLAALYGPSASGKSFLGFDMACAIADGQRWFTCRVEAAPVVYAALEGEAGFKLRAHAWEASRGRLLPERLRMMLQPFKLTEPQDVQDLAVVVPAGAVVFVDTLNRAAPTADENSSRDMGEILEAAKCLQSMTGGLVVLVHHTGKDSTRGLRGHSSLFAAMDAALEVSRDGDRREWKVAKSKDGQDGEAHPFKLRVETLAIDAHGDSVTSCVVEPDTAAQDVQRVKLPRGVNQRLVLDALRPMFKDGHLGKAGVPTLHPCIGLEAAVVAGAARLTCPTDKRNSRAREAITGLVAQGVLGLNEGWLWMV
jgi:putative DNA primase/helicase